MKSYVPKSCGIATVGDQGGYEAGVKVYKSETKGMGMDRWNQKAMVTRYNDKSLQCM